MRRDPLLHPAFLAALAGLWLNDHVWKYAYPGPLTGKLSDFAGLFMLPIVAHALVRRLGVRRLWPAGALTGLGALTFALANTWAPAQLAFDQALGALRWLPGLLTAALNAASVPPLRPVASTLDPSDLVALPVVLIGWRVVRGAPRSRRPRARSRYDVPCLVSASGCWRSRSRSTPRSVPASPTSSAARTCTGPN